MKTKKKRNAQDLTLRNLRALNRRIDMLERKIGEKPCRVSMLITNLSEAQVLAVSDFLSPRRGKR